MNLPGSRIAACLGKAALKTHALQTLRDCLTSPNRAKRLECVRFIGAFLPARDGPRFMARSAVVPAAFKRIFQPLFLGSLHPDRTMAVGSVTPKHGQTKLHHSTTPPRH